MGQREAVRRQRSGRATRSAIFKFAPAIADSITEQLRPFLAAGETFPDVRLLLTLIDRSMEARLQAFLDANTRAELERSDDAEPRERRSRLARELRARLMSIRSHLVDAYSPADRAALGVTKAPGQTPVDVDTYATTVLGALAKPDLVLRPKVEIGVELRPSAIVEQLAPHAAALSTALDDVAREEKELAEVTLERMRARDEHDANFVALAGLVEALARAAGLHDVADRIRPSTREPGVLHDEPEEPEDDTPTPTPAT